MIAFHATVADVVVVHVADGPPLAELLTDCEELGQKQLAPTRRLQLRLARPCGHPRRFDPSASRRVRWPFVSTHAKCLVVDETMSFITSANFTDRGQTRNIEVGVLIDDPEFAEKLAAHWRGLTARALVHAYHASE